MPTLHPAAPSVSPESPSSFFDRLVSAYRETHPTKNHRRPSLKAAQKAVRGLQALGLLPWVELASKPAGEPTGPPDTYPDEAPELSPAECFEPNEDEERWLASQSTGGCNPTELTPEEIAMHAGTTSEFDYWLANLDPTDVLEQLECEARCGLRMLS